MKTCPECKEEKSFTDYHKDKSRKDGLYVYCKPCTNFLTKKWRLDNPEKRRAIALKHDIKYRAENKDKIKEYNKKHYSENKEVFDAASRRRRARLANVETERYTDALILETYGTDCHICGDAIDMLAPRVSTQKGWELGLQLDHVIPISKGGPDLIVNIKPAHGKCNSAKRAKISTVETKVVIEQQEVCA